MSCSYVYSQDISGIEIILNADFKEGHQVNPEDAPKTRGVFTLPVQAYLYNNVVSVSFEEVTPSATIKITQESTGDTVYLQEYMSPSAISVDLSLQESGTYYIEIVSDTISLEGQFIL